MWVYIILKPRINERIVHSLSYTVSSDILINLYIVFYEVRSKNKNYVPLCPKLSLFSLDQKCDIIKGLLKKNILTLGFVFHMYSTGTVYATNSAMCEFSYSSNLRAVRFETVLPDIHVLAMLFAKFMFYLRTLFR
jgi:ribosome biogenesis protein Nip4